MPSLGSELGTDSGAHRGQRAIAQGEEGARVVRCPRARAQPSSAVKKRKRHEKTNGHFDTPPQASTVLFTSPFAARTLDIRVWTAVMREMFAARGRIPLKADTSRAWAASCVVTKRGHVEHISTNSLEV